MVCRLRPTPPPGCLARSRPSLLEQHGQAAFSRGPLGTDNPSPHLLGALSSDEDAETSGLGDDEFNHGSFDGSVFEHLEPESPTKCPICWPVSLGRAGCVVIRRVMLAWQGLILPCLGAPYLAPAGATPVAGPVAIYLFEG